MWAWRKWIEKSIDREGSKEMLTRLYENRIYFDTTPKAKETRWVVTYG